MSSSVHDITYFSVTVWCIVYSFLLILIYINVVVIVIELYSLCVVSFIVCVVLCAVFCLSVECYLV
jgi:hypothetical protein